MGRMKILEFCDAFYPNVDGAISVAKNYTEKLNKIADCKIAVPKASKRSKYVDKENFEVLRCNSLPAPEHYRNAIPFTDKKFKKRIKEESFDIFHTQTPFFIGKFAIKVAKKKHIPVVITLHTQYKRDFERVCKIGFINNIALKIVMRSYKKADKVWTVSEASKKILYDYGYKGEVDVVRNGTDYIYPDNPEELIQKVAVKHNLDLENPIFIFVGRMAYYKNIKLIADACKILDDKNKKYTMLFVGGGFELEDFKKYTAKLNIKNKVIFTGDVRDRELIQGYFLASDVLVFPSTFDMASITKVEAAAHKKPSIVVKDSCSAEEVIDNENGYLCEENAESIASKMLDVIDNREKAKQCGENAYKTIYRTWDVLAIDVLDRYQKIIDEYKSKNKKAN